MMFDDKGAPRLFGLPPGVDFPKALVLGLRQRMEGKPPEALARVDLIINTRRMERRVRSLFSQGPPCLLPKIHLLADLDMLEPGLVIERPVSPLQRRLELIALISDLLDREPTIAPRSSLYDLADSLGTLIDEMQGEGVTPGQIAALDVTDQSGHWERSLKFIQIAQHYLEQITSTPDSETRQRALVLALCERWAQNPPDHPVIVAGSTGSRGTTLVLLEAVARLPQGAIVLPGFDYDMPEAVWDRLDHSLTSEDHPQFRFRKLMRLLEKEPRDIALWHDAAVPSPARNALVSLSLRPAPVTDAWLSEGSGLRNINEATAEITMVQAPNPRSEALAIAMRLRQAAETGQTAALITPDRMLTRQVAAALDQWDILPDDSAGAPLHLSPPGRFLRHVVALLHRRLDAEALLTLLKHPLTHSNADRGTHVLNTRRLELKIRGVGLPYPDGESLRALLSGVVASEPDQQALNLWANWIGGTLDHVLVKGEKPLGYWVEKHVSLAEALAAGQAGSTTGELWQKNAGQQAFRVMENLAQHAGHGGSISARDYADLVGALLAEGEVRDRDAPHDGIMIWGTLEARVQGAELVILAGLNDGTWPESPPADPWLNRKMRLDAGLLLPERRIGLSAHDYQQAIAAGEVWLTRSIRSDDAETVASRWVNRLQNLLGGLAENGGPEALAAMIARGDRWLARAEHLEQAEDITPARRPSPRPPRAARPTKLSVTEIKTLIRDPYAIYAKHVLRLRKMGPLVQTPDALVRGILAHEIMEKFIRDTLDDPRVLTEAHLAQVSDHLLSRDVPWPAARALWQARITRIAARFVAAERLRQQSATPFAFEEQAKGSLDWPDLGFTLTARADRMDLTTAGEVIIYDYKTGQLPTKKQQKYFDKQLLIETAMVEQGAFSSIGARSVHQAIFLALGSSGSDTEAPINEEPPAEVLAGLRQLIASFLDIQHGFTSRRRMQKNSFPGDYDLLARYGEWDITTDAVPEDVR
jgi:double-strand break repair protein AddB